MWRTPKGERTLRGAEAQLIRSLIGHVVDEQEQCEDEPWRYGVSLFDDLLLPQKLVLLASVGEALLRDDIPCPPLNAMNEATLGVLVKALQQALDFETDMDGERSDAYRTYWRELTLGAVRELDGDDAELPDPSPSEMDDWAIMVDVLDSFLLWDDDWERPESVMDADPETARLIKTCLTIDDDYYLAIAPDPTDAEVAAARATLRRIAPPV